MKNLPLPPTVDYNIVFDARQQSMDAQNVIWHSEIDRVMEACSGIDELRAVSETLSEALTVEVFTTGS